MISLAWSTDLGGADVTGSSISLSINRALAEKQAAMVVAAAEAQKRMMETSTNGATRGCCSKC